MDALIREMIAFNSSAEIGPVLTNCCCECDERAMRVMVVKLLAWLGSKPHSTLDPLRLWADSTWSQLIIRLEERCPEFSRVFSVTGQFLSLNPSLESSEMDEIRNACRAVKRPPFMR